MNKNQSKLNATQTGMKILMVETRPARNITPSVWNPMASKAWKSPHSGTEDAVTLICPDESLLLPPPPPDDNVLDSFLAPDILRPDVLRPDILRPKDGRIAGV